MDQRSRTAPRTPPAGPCLRAGRGVPSPGAEVAFV
ncbi:hypothetical protein J2S47_000525 [Streptomyces griseoviridis]|jgi:hypothetical protein|uniref:Uncharacterized protein n=1 Tax=Streptomyces griseoviridis TaxID=45398 RepID=A0ABT9L8J5_STRGD|nr:hypothetical protein [Streptomyces griseoviridis]